MADQIPEQIDEMVRAWATHSTLPFQGKKRTKAIEHGLRLSILMAFKMLGNAVPQVQGVRFGYSWDEKNSIAVSVAPKDDLTNDMLIVTVGEELK